MSPRRMRAADGGITEAVWASQVEGLFRFYGWRWHHSPDNRPTTTAGGRAGRQRVGDPGFPDYIATRRLDGYGPELIIAELKRDKGTYRPGQREWLEDLGAFALDVMFSVDGDGAFEREAARPSILVATWRPRDREDVERVLAGPAGVGVLVDDRGGDVIDETGVKAVRSLVD